MKSKNGILYFMLFIVLLAALQPALAGNGNDRDSDGDDFLVWQAGFGLSQDETTEIIITRNAEFPLFDPIEGSPGSSGLGSKSVYMFIVTNSAGDIVGLVELENEPTSDNRRDTGRLRGFGFVGIDVSISPDGLLFINGEPFEEVIPNPRTGRYNLGVSLVGNHAGGQGNGNSPFGDATLSIVAPDGSTQTSVFVRGFLLNNELTDFAFTPSP